MILFMWSPKRGFTGWYFARGADNGELYGPYRSRKKAVAAWGKWGTTLL